MSSLNWGNFKIAKSQIFGAILEILISIVIYTVVLEMINILGIRLIVGLCLIPITEGYKTINGDPYAFSLECIYSTPYGMEKHHEYIVLKWAALTALNVLIVTIYFLIFNTGLLTREIALPLIVFPFYVILVFLSNITVIKYCYLAKKNKRIFIFLIQLVILLILAYLGLIMKWYYCIILYSFCVCVLFYLYKSNKNDHRLKERIIVRSVLR